MKYLEEGDLSTRMSEFFWLDVTPSKYGFGMNYYLCCGTHNDGDQLIYDRIM